MKAIVTEAEFQKLSEANEKVKGTNSYAKYRMMMEYKTKTDGRWSAWRFFGWGVPVPVDMKVKKVGDKIYLMKEGITVFGETELTRYTLTEACNEVLKVY